jgi:hypothetical protein
MTNARSPGRDNSFLDTLDERIGAFIAHVRAAGPDGEIEIETHHDDCDKRWATPLLGEIPPARCPTCRALTTDHPVYAPPLLEVMYAPRHAYVTRRSP